MAVTWTARTFGLQSMLTSPSLRAQLVEGGSAAFDFPNNMVLVTWHCVLRYTGHVARQEGVKANPAKAVSRVDKVVLGRAPS